MGIRVTYPNDGFYAGGKPRIEVFDDKTDQITFCRLATEGEALTYGLIQSMDHLSSQAQIIQQTIIQRS